jgi:hypothetical protein
MALRYAVSDANGTFIHGGEAFAYNLLESDGHPDDDRYDAEEQLRPLLKAGQRLTVGWDECVNCGAPLTDSIGYLSSRPYCSSGCREA